VRQSRLELGKDVWYAIDREADSIDHDRRWDAGGHRQLIRADDRRVRWNDHSVFVSEIAVSLREGLTFSCGGPASYLGLAAQWWVSENEEVLYRPLKTDGKDRNPIIATYARSLFSFAATLLEES